jgi:hypothetical protein
VLTSSTFVAQAVSTASAGTVGKESSFAIFIITSSPFWRVIEFSISHQRILSIGLCL